MIYLINGRFFLLLQKNALKSPPCKSLTRDTRNFILEKFLLDLQQAFDVHKFKSRNNLLHHSVNQKFTAFIDIFQNTLHKYAPYRSVTRKEAKLAKKP